MEALKGTYEQNGYGSYYPPQLPHGLTISTALEQQQGDDPIGGAQSGKSETINEALLLDPAAAAAMAAPAPDVPTDHAAAGSPAAPLDAEAAPDVQPATAGLQVAELCPLPPPDAAEGPEAAAEYELYLQRWEAGDTLAQRWHR